MVTQGYNVFCKEQLVQTVACISTGGMYLYCQISNRRLRAAGKPGQYYFFSNIFTFGTEFSLLAHQIQSLEKNVFNRRIGKSKNKTLRIHRFYLWFSFVYFAIIILIDIMIIITDGEKEEEGKQE